MVSKKSGGMLQFNVKHYFAVFFQWKDDFFHLKRGVSSQFDNNWWYLVVFHLRKPGTSRLWWIIIVQPPKEMQQQLKPLACEIQGKASCSPTQEVKLHFAAVNERVLRAGKKKKKGALETKRSSKRRSWAATKTIHVVWVLEMELPPLHNKGRLRRFFPLLTSASWQCPSDHVKQLCWAETI